MLKSRTNTIIYIFYLAATILVFVASLVFPQVRAVSYAPLRELILPEPEAVQIYLLYSTEKEEWLEEVIQDFYETKPRLNGHPIKIITQKMGSREMYLAVLDGIEQPVIISPASSLQISILEDLSASKFGKPLVNQNNGNCASVFSSPLVFVSWKERADVLWGDNPPENVWNQLHDDLINPLGWEAYNQPDWGYIKFGHTSPLTSNSGFMTILLMSYSYFNRTSGLTSQDILSNQGFQTWFLETENTISSFGDSTGTYMKDIIAYGPSVYDMVSVYEATAIEQAENAVGRYGELRVYYPPATVLSDHPFCTLNAEWVSEDQQQAAQIFLEYLQSPEAQQLALLKYGFRPSDPSISLSQSGSPFTRYAGNGLQTNLPPEITIPDGNALNTLLDFWARNVKK